MLRFYTIGLLILIVAILANVIAMKLNILTWYDYMSFLTKTNTSDITVKFIDYIWLFLVYPLTLGFGYRIGDYIYKLIFN
ncbi:DUF7672 family protein [Winogradskyella haliclonae]|uniref:DUF2798 domain-containing protein n=1 Tax=Winogradskyella haliclonae TaxID=2048558 RepID=A0ABQ2BYU7_9FLAO|nr:hypothetical protein [Winogradskyella haliclonae]GGI56953.1 hypothetical protein GCM10011444_12620 [Winogradskyella haliclonae]